MNFHALSMCMLMKIMGHLIVCRIDGVLYGIIGVQVFPDTIRVCVLCGETESRLYNVVIPREDAQLCERTLDYTNDKSKCWAFIYMCQLCSGIHL